MTKIRLQYIHEFRDRHGKVRRYVRLPGRKRVPLLGAPGSDESMEAYRGALAGSSRAEIGAKRIVPGTVNAAVASYFRSSAFQSLAPFAGDPPTYVVVNVERLAERMRRAEEQLSQAG